MDFFHDLLWQVWVFFNRILFEVLWLIKGKWHLKFIRLHHVVIIRLDFEAWKNLRNGLRRVVGQVLEDMLVNIGLRGPRLINHLNKLLFEMGSRNLFQVYVKKLSYYAKLTFNWLLIKISCVNFIDTI